MKNYLIIFAFLAMYVSIFSQEYEADILFNGGIPDKQNFFVIDTIKNIVEEATDIQGYVIPDLGPILGTGDVRLIGGNDTIYVMRCGKLAVCFPPIDGSTNLVIKEVLILFHAPEVVGVPEDIKVEIYSLNSDTTPGDLLSSSATISIADIKNNTYYAAKIDQCENIAGKPYLVVLEWDFNYDDEFGVMATNPQSGDGKKEMKTRLFVNETISGIPVGWQAAYNVFSNPENFDADAAIMLVVDVTTGIDTKISLKGLSLYKSCLSAHNGTATIKYGINEPQNVKITVFNPKGKIIIQTGMHYKKTGDYSFPVNLTGHAKGSYYFTIKTESTSLTGKIIYTK